MPPPTLCPVPFRKFPSDASEVKHGFMGTLDSRSVYLIGHFQDCDGNYVGYFITYRNRSDVLDNVAKMIGGRVMKVEEFLHIAVRPGRTRSTRLRNSLHGTHVKVVPSKPWRRMKATGCEVKKHGTKSIGFVDCFMFSEWWNLRDISGTNLPL